MAKKMMVEGEAIYMDGKSRSITFYEEPITLSGEMELGEARSMLRAGLMEDVLRKKIDGFKRIRTLQITEFKSTSEPEGKSKESSEYERLLLEATKLQCVPEGIDRYATAKSKAKAIKAAITKSKARKAKNKKKSGGELEPGYVD